MGRKTEAWILRRGESFQSGPGRLELATIELPEMTDTDVLAEPLYGCWEGNMTHALTRDPVDVCHLRGEPYVVLGNAGVVRILEVGAKVTTCKPGDICITVPNVAADELGNTLSVHAYDEPKSIGVLARQVVWDESVALPEIVGTRHALERWAGFPIRFATAWDNWQLTYGIWRQHFGDSPPEAAEVWAWGGGVAYAELLLAKRDGCRTTMIASGDERQRMLRESGIEVIDRGLFPDLQFDAERFESDRGFRAAYHKAETRFISEVRTRTERKGVSIFIDNIGSPVFNATLRALGRLGIITTCGWKKGKPISYHRPGPCVGRQIFVHTHGCSRLGGRAAAAYAEQENWLPPENPPIYDWKDIPQLAEDFQQNRLTSYFPVFQVNPA